MDARITRDVRMVMRLTFESLPFILTYSIQEILREQVAYKICDKC